MNFINSGNNSFNDRLYGMIGGMNMNIYERALQLQDETITHRRWFHTNAEVGLYMPKGQAYVLNTLKSYGIDAKICGHGVTATIGHGGKVILLRADMDALPITEETGLPFASLHEGCMHACGHDGHMASLLGFAKILDDYKKNKTDVKYNALLLFQPAEETIDGALKICGTNIFEKYNVPKPNP